MKYKNYDVMQDIQKNKSVNKQNNMVMACWAMVNNETKGIVSTKPSPWDRDRDALYATAIGSPAFETSSIAFGLSLGVGSKDSSALQLTGGRLSSF